jgi:hypothetical protein
MELLSLAAVILIAVCGYVALDRRDRRDAEERQKLLDRIQAPEAAPLTVVGSENDGELLSVPWDDDEAFAEVRAETSQ